MSQAPPTKHGPADLDGWGRLAERHWRKHRKKLVAELEAKGVLYDHLVEAQEQAAAMYDDLWKKGVPSAAADEMTMAEYILLPDVQDE